MNSYVVNLHPIPNGTQPGETLSVDNAAVYQFTTAFDPRTSCCYITVTGGDLHVTFDGSAPSGTNGHHLVVPFEGWWSKEAARLAKMKAQSGAVSKVVMSQFTY